MGGHDEAGAVLILALVFLVSVGMVILALVGWSGNDLLNTAHFSVDRSTNYSAGGATEVALWSVRYSYSTPTASPVACPGTNPSISIDGQFFEVWCSTAQPNPSSSPPTGPGTVNTRVVSLSTCQLTAAQASLGISSICAAPLLQATVTFNDFNNLNFDECSAATQGSCGTGMTVNKWAYQQ